MVCKRKDSVYSHARSKHWLKIKTRSGKETVKKRIENWVINILRFFIIMLTLVAPGLLVPVQVPPLPEGARTRWEIGGTDEIAIQLLFDTSTVVERLPEGLRFVTLADVASKFPPAQAHLVAHPEHAHFGVSFLEIAHQDLFSIDGREPRWPKDGAIAFWAARVIPAGLKNDRARGQEHVLLLILVPDRAYVEYMKAKRHYAEYGDVSLRRDESGVRYGTIQTVGLQVEAKCKPTSELKVGGPTYQTMYQPRGAMNTFLILAFSGNRDGECQGNWKISGSNPLTKAVIIGTSVFACCGSFLGGAYAMP
jgi:hypothetical protein